MSGSGSPWGRAARRAWRAWRGDGSYPIDRTDDRPLPASFRGPVLVFDIDGTYLATDLDRALGYVRIPLEFPVDKRNVPGTAALLRELRHGPGDTTRLTPLYFISASPPLLRGVIQRKMLADGVEPDGITFKRWSSLLLQGRFRQLKEQIAFKLAALLVHRAQHAGVREEWLFGDDREDDPLIYALYADVAGGRLRGAALEAVLARLELEPRDIAALVAQAEPLPALDPVRRVCIHLATGRPASRLDAFRPFVVATRDSVQAALALVEDGMLRPSALPVVARDAGSSGDAAPIDLEEALADAVRRGLASVGTAVSAVAALTATGLWEDGRPFRPPRGSGPPDVVVPGAPLVGEATLRWRRRR